VSGRPKLGFLGVGWIGRLRMRAVRESGRAEVVAVADPSAQMRRAALELAPEAEAFDSMAPLLERELDGVVIATPSSLHAEQSLAFLERGVAVFCQKPLGRDLEETRRVVERARVRDRLLGVDLCYRETRALAALRELARGGELGRVYAMELTFHNAYGPDKAWFYDRAQSGGGCVMDLGIHLVDAALWLAGFPEVRAVSSRLFSGGAPMAPGAVEDYALAQIELEGDVLVQLACSWNLPAGRDAVIEAKLWGTEGGAAFRNRDGSFFDFVAERYRGTATERLVEPPDDWGGRTVLAWVDRLGQGAGFDPEAARLLTVARVIDAIYAR
jgi:predicted dehydrogenase